MHESWIFIEREKIRLHIFLWSVPIFGLLGQLYKLVPEVPYIKYFFSLRPKITDFVVFNEKGEAVQIWASSHIFCPYTWNLTRHRSWTLNGWPCLWTAYFKYRMLLSSTPPFVLTLKQFILVLQYLTVLSFWVIPFFIQQVKRKTTKQVRTYVRNASQAYLVNWSNLTGRHFGQGYLR